MRPSAISTLVALTIFGCGKTLEGSTVGDASSLDAHEAAVGRDAMRDSAVPPCLIGSESISNGTRNPANACQACDSVVTAMAWTDVTDGTACGAGKSCSAGSCLGCSPSCMTDQDCQTGCTSDAGLSACCDTNTNSCFFENHTPCLDQVPPTCDSPCTSDSACQAVCGSPPEGTTLCCDLPEGICAPSTGPGCADTLTCRGIPVLCNSDSDCNGGCLTAPAGSVYCCYLPSNVCYVSAEDQCEN